MSADRRARRPDAARTGAGRGTRRRAAAGADRSDGAKGADARGRELELSVEDVAHGGVMVARHEGRVVFVSDALPGERVVARVTEARHERYWRASAVRVVEPSPHRVAHVWRAASLERDPAVRAGGAEYGHAALAHQRELKARVLGDALARFAELERPVVVEAADGDDERGGTGTRTRLDLHVDRDGRVGPLVARSRRVVAVDDLPLAAPELERAAPLGVRMPGSRSVRLVAGDDRAARVLVDGREEGRLAGEPVVQRVGGREYRIDPRGFWQVHRRAAGMLTERVRAALAPVADPAARHLDLYGGAGLFAGALADVLGRTARVTTVESDPHAATAASAALADVPGLTAVTGDTAAVLGRILTSSSAAERAAWAAGTVVLDPPRSGAGRDVVEALVALDPVRIVYVACDPVALARDLGAFVRAGRRVGAMTGLDLFPHTHHLEAVAVVDRSVP